MAVELNPHEARVLGCLMEKSVITPDQYPLTLNALVAACNQKSSREPVMSLDPGDVQRALRALQDKHIAVVDENFKTRVEKYSHRFCNTPFSDYQFDPAQYAIVTVLLLRGSRTPGELRSNSGRLHSFADNDEVVASLATLAAPDVGVVVELPRAPGRRDNEWRHTFSDEPLPAVSPTPVPEATVPGPGATAATEPTAASASLEQRVTRLEAEIAVLRDELGRLSADS